MTSSTLTLAPDEILTRSRTPAPLSGSASGPWTLKLGDEERPFLVRAVALRANRFVLFAGEHERPDAGNWLVCRRDDLSPINWPREPTNAQIEKVVRAWNPQLHTLARFSVVNGEDGSNCYALALSAEGMGNTVNIFHKTFRAHDRWLFDPGFEARALWDSPDIARARMRELVADPDSNLHFVSKWSRQSEEEKQFAVFGAHYSDIEAVVRWILTCDSFLWQRANEWRWGLSCTTLDAQVWLALWCGSDAPFRDPAVSPPPLLARLGRWLLRSYIPALPTPLADLHPCVRRSLPGLTQWKIEIPVPPTHHERVEAALKLREWLRAHDAPADIETLIAP